jgi:hypothetical protein
MFNNLTAQQFEKNESDVNQFYYSINYSMQKWLEEPDIQNE